jgi:hypothetical protein
MGVLPEKVAAGLYMPDRISNNPKCDIRLPTTDEFDSTCTDADVVYVSVKIDTESSRLLNPATNQFGAQAYR